jgi:hypothetical protein
MEIVFVHLNKFAYEIGSKVFAVFELQGFNIVVFKMTFSFHWAVSIGQKISSLRFQMWQNEFFNHEVLSAFLLDGVFLALVNVVIAFDNQILYKVVVV